MSRKTFSLIEDLAYVVELILTHEAPPNPFRESLLRRVARIREACPAPTIEAAKPTGRDGGSTPRARA